jgi:uncharacterized protein YmfQ (DUF2313 family)
LLQKQKGVSKKSLKVSKQSVDFLLQIDKDFGRYFAPHLREKQIEFCKNIMRFILESQEQG